MYKAQSKAFGGTYYGGGRVYIYHNTHYRTSGSEGAADGITNVGARLANTFSRNNILHHDRNAIYDDTLEPDTDLDYDLYQGSLVTASRQQAHGINAAPRYDPAAGFGPYALQADTPGHDDGAVVANFNDGFVGTGPDRGAQERGVPPLEFGVDAYR